MMNILYSIFKTSMLITGSPFKMRLTRGSDQNRPKVEVSVKSNEEILSFQLGEIECKKIAGELLLGKISINCDKKPNAKGSFFSILRFPL